MRMTSCTCTFPCGGTEPKCPSAPTPGYIHVDHILAMVDRRIDIGDETIVICTSGNIWHIDKYCNLTHTTMDAAIKCINAFIGTNK